MFFFFVPSGQRKIGEDLGVVEASHRPQEGLGSCEKPFGPFRKGQEKVMKKKYFIRKNLLTSFDVPEVPMYKGIEGKEVFAKHLLNTSSII